MLPAVLRYANVYGCKSTRHYVYIDDIVEANHRALHVVRRGAFNISTETEISVQQVYETVVHLLNLTSCQIGAPVHQLLARAR